MCMYGLVLLQVEVYFYDVERNYFSVILIFLSLRLEEKEALLVQLNEEISKLKAKITVLTDEIEVQKQKNNVSVSSFINSI